MQTLLRGRKLSAEALATQPARLRLLDIVLRYTLIRFAGMIGVLLAISILTFVIMHSIPGGPFDPMKMPVSATTQKNLDAKYGFDRPLYEQYLRYMWAALHGDLGVPFQSPGETVVGLLGRTWKVSATIGGISLIIAYTVGMLLGFVSAVRQNTWVDHVATTIAVLGVVTPSFVVALLLILILSLGLQLVPTGGW